MFFETENIIIAGYPNDNALYTSSDIIETVHGLLYLHKYRRPWTVLEHLYKALKVFFGSLIQIAL